MIISDNILTEKLKAKLQQRFNEHKAHVVSCRGLRKNEDRDGLVYKRLENLGVDHLTRAIEVNQIADELGISLDGLEGFLSPASESIGD